MNLFALGSIIGITAFVVCVVIEVILLMKLFAPPRRGS